MIPPRGQSGPRFNPGGESEKVKVDKLYMLVKNDRKCQGKSYLKKRGGDLFFKSLYLFPLCTQFVFIGERWPGKDVGVSSNHFG